MIKLLQILFLLMTAFSPAVLLADLSESEEASVMEMSNGYTRMGTAFAVGNEYAVTAAHVIDGYPYYHVIYRGRPYAAMLERVDWAYDFAIIKVPGLSVDSPLAFSRSVSRGEDVSVYGFPSGKGFSKSNGRVTSVARPLMSGGSLRAAGSTNAKVYGGYSGGPVVNRHTNLVVGVLTNKESLGIPTLLKGLLTGHAKETLHGYTDGYFTRCDQLFPRQELRN